MAEASLNFDVFGLGTLVVDHQMFVDHFPDANTKNVAHSQRIQVGGPVVTALTTLAALGNRSYFVGRWNPASYGSLIEADFESSGIRYRPCAVDADSKTGVAHVWVDRSNGDRTIVVTRGTEIAVSDIDWDVLSQSRALHLDGWPMDAALSAAEQMRVNGRPVFLDTGSPKAGYDRLIPNVDVLICPEATAAKYYDESDGILAARKFLECGPLVVAVTSGASGAVIYTQTDRFQIEAYRVEVVDSNGAGDVFAGAFIHETLQRLRVNDPVSALRTLDWQAIGQFAAAVAAIKCQSKGNRTLPTLEQTNAFITNR